MARNYLVKSVVPSTYDLVARDSRIQWALRLIWQNRAVHITDIAKSLNLSDSRFRHLFTEELGICPRDYLRLARLERAKDLLENSFLRVKEVTALVGINDISHFVRDYKAIYKQTPSQTRANR